MPARVYSWWHTGQQVQHSAYSYSLNFSTNIASVCMEKIKKLQHMQEAPCNTRIHECQAAGEVVGVAKGLWGWRLCSLAWGAVPGIRDELMHVSWNSQGCFELSNWDLLASSVFLLCFFRGSWQGRSSASFLEWMQQCMAWGGREGFKSPFCIDTFLFVFYLVSELGSIVGSELDLPLRL